MNKEESLKTDIDMKEYLQKNKLRSLFSQLTKQLLLKRPDDPISYLIEHLQKRNKRQIICIQGYDHEKRNKIASNVANKYNFHLINLSIFLGDNFHSLKNSAINEVVLEEIKKVDKIYKGIVISGYPNNSNQADTLQKSGNLPDRYYLLHQDEVALSNSYIKNHSEEETSLLVDRSILQNKELKEFLGDKYDELPTNIDKAIERINNAASIKFKKIPPLDSPRILVLHPPFLVPKALHSLQEKYGFNLITIERAFNKLSHKQNFKEYVQSHIRKHKQLTKQIELALIETQAKSAASKSKGFIVAGWPIKEQSLPFVKQHFLNPHIIFIFNSLKEKAFEDFKKLSPDDQNIFPIIEKPTLEEYKLMYKQYQGVAEQLKNQNNTQIFTLNQSDAQVLKAFENLIDNPKIYN